jgi:hypothetical protein
MCVYMALMSIRTAEPGRLPRKMEKKMKEEKGHLAPPLRSVQRLQAARGPRACTSSSR